MSDEILFDDENTPVPCPEEDERETEDEPVDPGPFPDILDGPGGLLTWVPLSRPFDFAVAAALSSQIVVLNAEAEKRRYTFQLIYIDLYKDSSNRWHIVDSRDSRREERLETILRDILRIMEKE